MRALTLAVRPKNAGLATRMAWYAMRLFAPIAMGLAAWPQWAAAQAVTAEVLRESTYFNKYPAQYLRLTKPGRSPTYAIWFPPVARAAGVPPQNSAVLLTNPYAGIDWTQDVTDNYAAALANTDKFTMIPDVFGPGYTNANPTFVSYDLSVFQDAGGFALPYVMNGFGAIIVFERFYAGGSLQSNIDDTLTALEFIKNQPGIDPKRLGIWGSSWGGSLATYAAAQAPDDQKPLYGVACTPILDFQRFADYAWWLPTVANDKVRAYYRIEPYARRVLASAYPNYPNGASDYSKYKPAALTAGLKTKFLFMHDVFDTISPYPFVADFYFSKPSQFDLLLYPHQGAAMDWANFDVTHGPLQPGFTDGTALLFSYAYLLTRMSVAQDWILMPIMPNLNADEYFSYMHQQQQLGFEINRYLTPRLLDLCDQRLFIVDYTNQFTKPVWGRQYVADMVNKYWGLSLRADTVVDYLKNHGL